MKEIGLLTDTPPLSNAVFEGKQLQEMECETSARDNSGTGTAKKTNQPNWLTKEKDYPRSRTDPGYIIHR